MDKGVFFLPHLLDVASLARVVDDFVRSFPVWTERALGRIFRCWSYRSKDEVTDVKFFQIHPSIVVFSYLLLVLGHPLRSLISYFVHKVQVLL